MGSSENPLTEITLALIFLLEDEAMVLVHLFAVLSLASEKILPINLQKPKIKVKKKDHDL